MSNFRRSGGNMGGGNRSGQNRNNSFQQPFQSSVSPWQGATGMGMNQGSGFLSQLTTNPQQLALALSTLLQPQAQVPPSLMSMNNSNNSGMNRGGNYDRFNNRGRDINRRHEPYNKNRGGNFNRDNNRNRNQGRNKKDDRKKDDKEEKKDKKGVKKEKESKNDADQSMDEEEKKRDWKDEKKSADDDDDNASEKSDDEKTDGSKDGKFFKIPPQYLTCFVCNKQMWDGVSMEKHLRGRAHSEMIKALEESIGITVGILRENMRLTEERNIIEMFRIQRTKKFNKFRGPEESCNMCDLRFRGKMSSHRRSEGHQRLKRYLHPKCNLCDKEFHARIEWVEHRMTPDHLRKHCEKLEEHAEAGQRATDGATVITNVEEEDNQEIDLDKLLIEPLQMDNGNAITELDDTLENVQNRYPAYKNDRPLGTKSLVEFAGFLCELCNKSFTFEEDAKKHLTTQRHYYKFVEAIKNQWDQKEKREKEEREEAARLEKEEKVKAEAENGEEEGEEEVVDQEMEESLNDSAMETADETLNSTQEEEPTLDESQETQEEDEEVILEEEEEVKEEEKKVEVKPAPKKAAPAAKPGPASKKAAAANKPGPASSKNANNASPGPRSRKARK